MTVDIHDPEDDPLSGEAPGKLRPHELGIGNIFDILEVAVAGDIVDSSTGETLVRFTHARKSGVGIYGGDYADFLRDDATDVGADVGMLVAAFSKPEGGGS